MLKWIFILIWLMFQWASGTRAAERPSSGKGVSLNLGPSISRKIVPELARAKLSNLALREERVRDLLADIQRQLVDPLTNERKALITSICTSAGIELAKCAIDPTDWTVKEAPENAKTPTTASPAGAASNGTGVPR